MTKSCTKCKEIKPVAFFTVDRDAGDGLSRWCKLCRKKHNETLTYEPVMEGEKNCSKCNEIKSVLEFHRAKCKRGGRSSQCKSCRTKEPRRIRTGITGGNKQHQSGNLKGVAKKRRNILPPEDRRFRVALAASRRSAKRRGGFPCDATVEELKAAFTGKCHICEVPEIECNQKLHMDHDHSIAVGNFRGWLCYHHNNMLGRAGDSEEILINALHYLMSSKGHTVE